MTFVTKVSLESGDRAALDRVVEQLRSAVQRKGAPMKGPHSDPPTEQRVPLYKRPTAGDDATFGNWMYTVYYRRIEIEGHDELARRLTRREYPDSVRVEVEIERVQPMGSNGS